MINKLKNYLLTCPIFHLKINSSVDKTSKISRMCKVKNSQIGFYTYVGPKTTINNTIIGNYCSISSNVRMGLGNHPTTFFSTSPIFYGENNIFNNNNYIHLEYNEKEEFKKISIGNDVWIGAEVIILDGVKIGNGAVVAAGSVVTKDVANYSIVGGVPAKLIKRRFDDKTIIDLENSSWWDKRPENLISEFQNLKKITNLKCKEN